MKVMFGGMVPQSWTSYQSKRSYCGGIATTGYLAKTAHLSSRLLVLDWLFLNLSGFANNREILFATVSTHGSTTLMLLIIIKSGTFSLT